MRCFKTKTAALALAAAVFAATAHAQSPATPETSFVYQGVLELNGQPYNGPADIRFDTVAFADSPLVGFDGRLENVMIENGLINARITPNVPVGRSSRFLAIEVSAPPGSPFVQLFPNQRLLPAPRATQAEGAEIQPDGSVVFQRGRAFGSFASQPTCDAPYADSIVFQTFTTPGVLERVSSVRFGLAGGPAVNGFVSIALYEGEDEDAGPVIYSPELYSVDFAVSGSVTIPFPYPFGPELQPDTVYTLALQALDDQFNAIQANWCVASSDPYAGGCLSNGPPNTDLDFFIGYTTEGSDRAFVDANGGLNATERMTIGDTTLVTGAPFLEISNFDLSAVRLGMEPSVASIDLESGGETRDAIDIEAGGALRVNPNTILPSANAPETTVSVEALSPELQMLGRENGSNSIRLLQYDQFSNLQSGWAAGIPGPDEFVLSHIDSGDNPTRRITLKPDGLLGLNNSNPLAPLHVGSFSALDSSGIASHDIIAQSENAVLGLFSTPAGTGGSAITLGQMNGTGGISNQWTIVRETTSGGNDLLFSFGSDANYGVNPTLAELRDNGDFAIAGQIFQGSSAELKQDVAEIKNALDTILAMRGVTYTWKNTGEADLGFIAEEMAEVLPEIVNFENGKPAGIDYGRITALLVEAVKQQEYRLNSIEERLRRLELGADADSDSESQ